MVTRKDYVDGELSIFRKGVIPASSDNQIPYEEREAERDDEVQDTFSLVCLICEPIFVFSVRDQDTHCDKAHKPVDTVTDIPLYLSQRVFLI
jgi:hypothetical protein